MVLLISYDLNGQERPASYAQLRQAIEQHAGSSIRPLYSQWLVETNSSPRAWFNALEPLIDPNDRLLIVQVTNRSYWGYLDKAVFDWLAARGLEPAS
jgi:hypothetical protein